jgi:aspartyl/asparaginyl beta-hydroxylase (cupin superfamily)
VESEGARRFDRQPLPSTFQGDMSTRSEHQAGMPARGSAAVDPAEIRGLIRKADGFAEAGDARSASAFYGAALRAAPPPGSAPPDLAADLRRAQQMYTRYRTEYTTYLRAQLAARGFGPERTSSRFAQSVDIALGERRIFVQEPRYYYFPELPQIQFYDRGPFPWLDEVESATDAIRAELTAIMSDAAAFTPYVTGHANRPRRDQLGMLNNPAWSAFYLWKNGQPVAANVARFPNTMHALRNAPLSHMSKRSPSILFSLLRPGAHIPPHNGFVNARLICHLPVIVPGLSRFRVGNETRQWVEGRAWQFDDTIEHEAWNDGDQARVILLFDVWRPELSDEERRMVSALFEAIDAYDGTTPEWDD